MYYLCWKCNIFSLFAFLQYIGQSRFDKGSGTERVMDAGHDMSQAGLEPGSQCLIACRKVLGILLYNFFYRDWERKIQIKPQNMPVKHHFTWPPQGKPVPSGLGFIVTVDSSSTAGFVRGVGSLFLVYWDTLLSLQHEAMFYPYMSAHSLCLSDFQSSAALSTYPQPLRMCVCTRDQGCHYWIDASLCLTRLCRFSTLCEQRPNSTHKHTTQNSWNPSQGHCIQSGSRGTCVERAVLL